MTVSENLREKINSYFDTRDTNELPLMELPEAQEVGSEYLNLLVMSNCLIETFDDLTTPEVVSLYSNLYKDPGCLWVVDSLAWRIEEMYRSIADGTLEIKFDGKSKSTQSNEIDQSANQLELVYKMDGKNVVSLGFTFLETIGSEIALDELAKKEYLANIVSLAWLTSEVRQNPNKFKFDKNMEKWKMADGPSGLIILADKARATFMKVCDEYWDGWKNY